MKRIQEEMGAALVNSPGETALLGILTEHGSSPQSVELTIANPFNHTLICHCWAGPRAT